MTPTDIARPAPPPIVAAPPTQPRVLVAGIVLAATLGAGVWASTGGRMVIALGLGLTLGLTLFHSRFGFTSAWRQLVAVGQGTALRAHMLMLAVGVTLFAVIVPAGFSLTGHPQLKSEPVGVGLLVGAFLFGIGMQLGGSCASGTLFSIGSGQTSILLTLAGFVAGSMLALGSWGFWKQDLPNGLRVDLAAAWGRPIALVVSLAVMGSIALAAGRITRHRNPPPPGRAPSARGVGRVLRGSWPLWVGAVVLGVLNAAILVVTGSPWGITSAFALWGSKIAEVVGAHPENWSYWRQPGEAAAISRPVLANATSVIDFGIMLGALIASALGGVFRWHRRVPARTAAAAVLGGTLMGYGARISGGCNIGAYFSGIASLSLHGWVWGAMAILGTFAGVAARPLFGLAVPRDEDSIC